MLLSLAYKNIVSRPKLLWVAFVISTLLCYIIFRNYLSFTSIPFVLGAMALMFNIKDSQVKGDHAYGYAALLFTILTMLLPVKTLFFYSVGFVFFFLLQFSGRGIGFSGLLILIFICPAFQYVINTLSFPLRLHLTKWVSHALRFFYSDLSAAGNILYYQGKEFSVDQACAGLNMLIASLLSGLILTAYHQAKQKRWLNWYVLLLVCLTVLGLNIVGNFIRIALLVLFAIMPSNWMHDVVGLMCFIVYTMIPTAAFIKFVIRKFGVESTVEEIRFKRFHFTIKWLLVLLIPIAYVKVLYGNTYKTFASTNMLINGYEKATVAPGIIKLTNESSLVYLKYIRGFYDTDHNPSICWKGSGYEFHEVRTEKIGDHELYSAQLRNAGEKLYTAWWYDNGKIATVSHWKWRTDMLKGEPSYSVVNVTATSRKDLLRQVNLILQEKPFLKLLIQK